MNARAAILLLSVPLLAACHPSDGEDALAAAKATTDQALAPRDVRLVQPDVRREHPTLELVGEVRPFDTIPVPAEVAGRMDSVRVEVGDSVSRGQRLADIDQETYRLQVDQAEARLAAARADLNLAEKELERKADLLTDDTVPQAVYDQVEAQRDLAAANLAAAESSLSLARRDLERSTVRAPAAGVVSRRHAVGGQWIDVGMAVVDIAVGDRLKVAAHVPGSWAANLRSLKTFTFTVGDGDEQEASVYSIEPVIEGASRSFEVIGTHRPDPDGGVRPGRFATITLRAPEARRTMWLPTSAVATGDLTEVMVVEDGRIVVRKVLTGRTTDGSVEILEGLGPEQPVIRDVAGLARDLPVNVIE